MMYSNTIENKGESILKTHFVKDKNGKILAQQAMQHLVIPWDNEQKLAFLKNNLTLSGIDLAKGWVVFQKS